MTWKPKRGDVVNVPKAGRKIIVSTVDPTNRVIGVGFDGWRCVFALEDCEPLPPPAYAQPYVPDVPYEVLTPFQRRNR